MAQSILAGALVVPDYDAALSFYVDKLGFRQVEDVAQSADKRWVTIAPPGDANSGTLLLLARAATDDQRKAIGNQSGGRVFLFLQTDSFDEDYIAMRAAGVVFEESPRDEPYGKVAVWRDPFGNRWDLLEKKST